jgi:hypothetical protein
MDFGNIRCENVDGIKPEQDGAKLRAVVNMTMVRPSPFKAQTFMTSYKTISVSQYTLY